MRTHVFECAGVDGTATFKALSSEARVKILELLADGDRNINQLAQALGQSQPSVTNHVNVLEAAGLVTSDYAPGLQGTQKRCRLVYDRLTFTFGVTPSPATHVEELEMPVGLFSAADPAAPCGMATAGHMIEVQDLPQIFFLAERCDAQILWMSQGYVEYTFANRLPSAAQVRRLELSCEVCSECRDYNLDYPSDITVWVNGSEIGTWTSPGDMGGKRGRLNPEWWPPHGTQFGFLKTWSVEEQGASVDEVPVPGRTVADLGLAPGRPIRVRIGVKPEAVHPGGFNLFGRNFGNYEQDLVLRLHYSPPRS